MRGIHEKWNEISVISLFGIIDEGEQEPVIRWRAVRLTDDAHYAISAGSGYPEVHGWRIGIQRQIKVLSVRLDSLIREGMTASMDIVGEVNLMASTGAQTPICHFP